MPELCIDGGELTELALALCRIESPAGKEAEVGNFVFEWMGREGFGPRRIGMFADRFNVLGMLPGLGEGTDFGYAAIEAGKAFFKITVFGEDQFYTPFVPDAEVDISHPNAIVRAALFVPRLQQWAREYERRFVYSCASGTIVPKAVIGAIRGDNPYHVTRTSELCALYIDCRLTPDSDPLALRRELRELLAASGAPCSVDLF